MSTITNQDIIATMFTYFKPTALMHKMLKKLLSHCQQLDIVTVYVIDGCTKKQILLKVLLQGNMVDIECRPFKRLQNEKHSTRE